MRADLDLRLKALDALYGVHGSLLEDLKGACRPGCSACCTVNLTATALEVRYLLDRVGAPAPRPTGPYYRPAYTANEAAEACLSGAELPEDPGEHSPEPCPLLGPDGLCTVYEARPFACRAMHSSRRCAQGGAADMDPYLLTVSLVFYQLIEHLDEGEPYGSLWDVLDRLSGRPVRGLLESRALPGLPVPPEHRGRLTALLRRLGSIEVDGVLLHELFGLQSPGGRR